MTFPAYVSDWLTRHSAAIQAAAAAVSALLATVLTGTTLYYAWEAKRSRKAAEKSASAAREQLEFLKRQYEDLLGLGPQILREALLRTKEQIKYWTPMVGVGIGNPHGVPDPAPLVAPLAHALEHARRVSPECSERVSYAMSELQLAKSEFETIRQSYRGPGLSPAALHGAGPTPHLQNAEKSVDEALAMLPTKSAN